MTLPPKPIVLIAEDEVLIRMMAAEIFREEGFVVLEAEDAESCLTAYELHSAISLLFTDVNMPGAMNGIDLAEMLIGRSPALRIIITSALPILRPVRHFPATFIPKPYEARAVCQMARGLLAA